MDSAEIATEKLLNRMHFRAIQRRARREPVAPTSSGEPSGEQDGGKGELLENVWEGNVAPASSGKRGSYEPNHAICRASIRQGEHHQDRRASIRRADLAVTFRGHNLSFRTLFDVLFEMLGS